MKSTVRKVLVGALARVRNFVNHRLIHPVDCRVPEREQNLPFPPIFIIGPPRSGSTLLMQVLVDAFDFGYFSNLHCTLFGAPSVAERFFYSREKRQKSSFSSEYGQIDGRLAPSECGEYWYRFFPRHPMYAPMRAVTTRDMRLFRRSLTRFVEACGRPVLFKNMPVALRLEPILKTVPEALFIVIHRDVVNNAVSLLEARKSIYGNYETWWSMEPPRIDELKGLPAAQQVVEQVRQIHSLIEDDFHRYGIDRKRILNIGYEEFSEDVDRSLRDIDAFMQNNGIAVSRLFDVPKQFSVSTRSSVPVDLVDSVRSYASGA